MTTARRSGNVRMVLWAVLLIGLALACEKSAKGPTGPTAPTGTAPLPPPPPPAPRSIGPIAFVSTRDGSPFIYVANADGSAVTRLVSGRHPAWSHDGRRIAFNGVDSGIYVMNADGSGQIRLGVGGFPDWSPDGTKIVFNSLCCGMGAFSS